MAAVYGRSALNVLYVYPPSRGIPENYMRDGRVMLPYCVPLAAAADKSTKKKKKKEKEQPSAETHIEEEEEEERLIISHRSNFHQPT